jgi:type IV secretory pathway VirB2 component (pilin)
VRDILLFYSLPLAVAVPALVLSWSISAIDEMITALALMTGLLFNLLVLLFGNVSRAQEAGGRLGEHRLELIRQLQANVTYALLVALIATIALGLAALAGEAKVGFPWAACLIYLLVHFVLLLAMVLRRIRVVFLHELRSGS